MKLPSARITSRNVFIGDVALPDLIAEDGVTVRIKGDDDFNRVVVEFLVSDIEIQDSIAERVNHA